MSSNTGCHLIICTIPFLNASVIETKSSKKNVITYVILFFYLVIFVWIFTKDLVPLYSGLVGHSFFGWIFTLYFLTR